jgi:hypothetical protein
LASNINVEQADCVPRNWATLPFQMPPAAESVATRHDLLNPGGSIVVVRGLTQRAQSKE